MFFFFYLSYLSFYLSFKYFLPSENKWFYIGSGLLYSLNSFSINIFSYPWGFTHQVLIYIFIPPLVLLFVKILLDKVDMKKNLLLFLIIFVISIVAYNNIAYFLAILFLQLIIFICLLVSKTVLLNKMLILKLAGLASIYLIAFFWFVLSFYSSLASFSSQLSHDMAFGGDTMNIVRATSNTILNIFSFNINGFNFQTSVSYGLYGIILLCIIVNIKKINKLQLIFLAVFIFLVFLCTRIAQPFDFINYQIYSFKVFQFFRSPDKLFIFLPFVYVALFSLLMIQSTIRNKFKIVIFFVLLILPYNFYLGNTVRTLNKLDDNGYKYVINIPDQYKTAFNAINRDLRLNSVLSLPYSVDNSINWANYPKWYFVGQDVLGELTNKFYISANTYDHPNVQNILSFKVDNEKRVGINKLLSDLEKFSGGYIFYHKDIDPRWIIASKYINSLLAELKSKHILQLTTSNDYFDLYKVADKYLMPLISSSGNLLFKQINPTKYKVNLALKDNQSIILNQSYNPEWKLFLDKNPNGLWCKPLFKYSLFPTTECVSKRTFFEGEELSYLIKQPLADKSHVMVNDYANKWVINENYIKQNYSPDYYKVNSDGSINIELTMYFKPQSYFYIGIVADGLLLIFGFVTLSLIYIYEKKHKV
jgi:hypothetical protein